jgi:hypothetical protein
MADWEDRCMAAHAADVAQGLHDDQCEYGRTLKLSRLMLCNCSKRRREAAGFTSPPSDDLDFPPPDCPGCDRQLDHDGDSWRCYECCLSWDSGGSGASCEFTDDFGDLSGSEAV